MSNPATGQRPPTALPWAGLDPVPWKNGAGTTRRLASIEASWRVSVADIPADSTFSAYPGIDRTLMVITGGGLRLAVDGQAHEVGLHEPISFRGESATSCQVTAGPVRAVNLMTTRTATSGSLAAVEVHGSWSIRTTPTESLVLLLLAGDLLVDPGSDPIRLAPLDGAWWTGARSTPVHGDGTLALARVGSLPAPAARDGRPGPPAR